MIVKLKRNDPCICGSGLKYKKCHMEVHIDQRVGYEEGLPMQIIHEYTLVKDLKDRSKSYFK